MEIETDKATLDVPSGVAGTITSLHVAEGQTIAPGTVLVTVLESAGAGGRRARLLPPLPPPLLRRPRRSPTPEPPPPLPLPRPPPKRPPTPARQDISAALPPRRALGPHPGRRHAAGGFRLPFGSEVRPADRRRPCARVAGSGPAGRISEDDVMRFARTSRRRARAVPGRDARRPARPPARLLPLGPRAARAAEPLPPHGRAQHVAGPGGRSPAVTLQHTADVTELEAVRRRHRQAAIDAGGRLTVTAILLKIVASALRAHPRVNASFDADAQELVLKQYVHIGVAVDTDRGLVGAGDPRRRPQEHHSARGSN